MEPRALHMLGKCSTTKLHAPPKRHSFLVLLTVSITLLCLDSSVSPFTSPCLTITLTLLDVSHRERSGAMIIVSGEERKESDVAGIIHIQIT
jgi:hypothetical protein